ncbi:MAG: hypothetical protein IJ445_07035 [Clostridia bacterium]|nr:hypothetical protein [Clostridia bacterium]
MFITDEEKNQIALSSAMALPNDPSRAGMKPDQIKKVLFAPTKKLIEYLNVKLANYDEIGNGKTPIKGIDYFTEADKRELVEAVIEAIPSAEGVSF